MEKYSDVIERFLTYVKIDTQSDENSGLHPSTEKQKNLGRLLVKELKEMRAEDVVYDEAGNYVYAKIPATDGGKNRDVLGFIAHMDTSPETSGTDVKPQFHENYDGEDIVLNTGVNGEAPVVLSPEMFPEMLKYKGKTLITTDGTTLLGADDKAGVSEIMSMAKTLLEDYYASKENGTEPKFVHGKIAVAFTPDEEIGEGTVGFNLDTFGADYAYTVDGGELGELEYENFNAAAARVVINGVTIHPGEAKGKMKNAAVIGTVFQSMLPEAEVPEKTEGREGFYYLSSFEGSTESATLSYIIRDHDRAKFEAKKQNMLVVAEKVDAIYGEGTVEVTLRDQYYNMIEKIDPDYMFLVDGAAQVMKNLDIKPLISPIRGGTDGATLSFKGLPCPNLCAGGHNFHGKYEYVCMESMEKITELILAMACTITRK